MAPNNNEQDKEKDGIMKTTRGTQLHKQTGKVVTLNRQKIVLFRFKDKVYALDEKCPHMGEQ